MVATTIFGVTAAMVKRAPVVTDKVDAEIELIAQDKEYWVAKKTGYSTAPSDTIDLGNLRRMVVLETAMALMSPQPHSTADGPVRMEHYPQLQWMAELTGLYDEYGLKTDPVIWEQPVE